MIYFRIELDTRGLTVEEENRLSEDLENVPCSNSSWMEYPQGRFSVTPVQLPECVDKDAEDWICGSWIIEGEVVEDVLENIYTIIYDAGVPYTDNDPLGIEEQAKMDAMLIGFMDKRIMFDDLPKNTQCFLENYYSGR